MDNHLKILTLETNVDPKEYMALLEHTVSKTWYLFDLDAILAKLSATYQIKEFSSIAINKIGVLKGLLGIGAGFIKTWEVFEKSVWALTAGLTPSIATHFSASHLLAFIKFLYKMKIITGEHELSDEVKSYMVACAKINNIIVFPEPLEWLTNRVIASMKLADDVRSDIDKVRANVKKVSANSTILDKIEEYLYEKPDFENVPASNYFVLWQTYQTVKVNNESQIVYAQPEESTSVGG